MKPKTMILMIVAVGCGLAASYMTSKLLADRKTAPPDERVDILVAKTKVPRFTLLKDPEKFFEIKKRDKADLPAAGYFSDAKELKDKRVNRELRPGSEIVPEDVQDHLNTFLPVPDGYGSMGVKVTQASAVSYFVAPGDKVDILLTTRGDQASASTILREVLVLAVADKIVREEGSGQPTGVIPAQTVTIAVKPDDSKLVRLAENVGELSLVLLKDGDKTEWKSNRIITLKDLERAGRATSFVNTPTEVTPPAAPTTTAFGLPLEILKKQEPKEEPEVKIEPIKPKWEVTIEYGNAPSLKIPYYEKDGSLTREGGEPAPKKP